MQTTRTPSRLPLLFVAEEAPLAEELLALGLREATSGLYAECARSRRDVVSAELVPRTSPFVSSCARDELHQSPVRVPAGAGGSHKGAGGSATRSQQRWLWANQRDGWAELWNHRNGKCLDLNVHEARNGGTVQVWDCNGQDQQKWRPENVNGAWRLVNKRYGCLDADWNGRYVDGKRVQVWACGNTDNQLWPAD